MSTGWARGAWPSGDKPIRLIVPFPAGSISDVQTRPLAQLLAAALKHPVIVDNRPGGNGLLGVDAVAKAPPDGYTLLMGPIGPLVVMPHTLKVPYDTLKDLVPITRVTSGPMVLLSNPQAPFDSVAKMVEYSRARPGDVKVGGYGVGGSTHLTVLRIANVTGADLTHVPYQGGPQQVTDAVGGQIPLLLDFPAVTEQYVKAGRLKALAVTGPKRYPQLPDVPTFEELGYKGATSIAWQGVLAPTGTPTLIVQRLNQELRKALALPELRESAAYYGAELGNDSPEEFGAFIRTEYDRWGQVVRDNGVKLP